MFGTVARLLFGIIPPDNGMGTMEAQRKWRQSVAIVIAILVPLVVVLCLIVAAIVGIPPMSRFSTAACVT